MGLGAMSKVMEKAAGGRGGSELPRAALGLLAVALLGVVLAGCSSGGAITQGVDGTSPSPDAITVLGTATVLAAPDEAVLTIAVETEGADAAPAVDENSKRMKAVLDRLKAEGLSDEALETTAVTVYPVEEHDPRTGKVTVRAFRAQNTIRATITKMDTVGKVYAAAVEAGANNVHGPEWRLSDNSAAVQDALAKAVASARGKAEALAQAADAGVGEILSLREEASAVPPIFSEGDMRAAAEVAEPPIQEQKLTVTAQVTATYRLRR